MEKKRNSKFENKSDVKKIRSVTGLANLDALFFTEREIDNLFKSTMLISS